MGALNRIITIIHQYSPSIYRCFRVSATQATHFLGQRDSLKRFAGKNFTCAFIRTSYVNALQLTPRLFDVRMTSVTVKKLFYTPLFNIRQLESINVKTSLNFIRLIRVVITPSGGNDSKQSDEFQAM